MNQPTFAAYTGPSMNPTLVEPEMVEVKPYTDRAPRVGDVIYFHAPTDDRDIAHRITAITPAGIRTRGDNNPGDDSWLIQPRDIVGRVVAAQCGKARRAIYGGRVGVTQYRFLRVWRRVNRRVARVLHAPYHALARTGIARAWLPARWRPRAVAFQETRLLMFGARVIGRYDARRGQWAIQRPFRLFVNEAELSLVISSEREKSPAHDAEDFLSAHISS